MKTVVITKKAPEHCVFSDALLEYDETNIAMPNTGIIKKHYLYRFPNMYGASVIQSVYTIGKITMPFSYGAKEHLWELAVLRFTTLDDTDGKYDYHLEYETPITDDVIGHLTLEQVDEYLEKIKNLEQPSTIENGEKSYEGQADKRKEPLC